MAKFIGKRLLMLLPVVLGVVFIVFTILRLSPTDPIRTVLGDMATEEAVQEMREEMARWSDIALETCCMLEHMRAQAGILFE